MLTNVKTFSRNTVLNIVISITIKDAASVELPSCTIQPLSGEFAVSHGFSIQWAMIEEQLP